MEDRASGETKGKIKERVEQLKELYKDTQGGANEIMQRYEKIPSAPYIKNHPVCQHIDYRRDEAERQEEFRETLIRHIKGEKTTRRIA